METTKRTIWKFEFPIEDEFEIKMPRYAKILHVQMQGSTPCIWALVDLNVNTFKRAFALRGTGHECNGLTNAYIGSFFAVPDGSLVYHLFDLGWRV